MNIVREMSVFSGRPYAECWDFVEFIKHSLRDIPQTQCLIKELAGKGYRLFCLSNMSLEFYVLPERTGGLSVFRGPDHLGSRKTD